MVARVRELEIRYRPLRVALPVSGRVTTGDVPVAVEI